MWEGLRGGREVGNQKASRTTDARVLHLVFAPLPTATVAHGLAATVM